MRRVRAPINVLRCTTRPVHDPDLRRTPHGPVIARQLYFIRRTAFQHSEWPLCGPFGLLVRNTRLWDDGNSSPRTMRSVHGWLLIAVVATMPLAALPVNVGPIQLPITELLLSLAVLSAVICRIRDKGAHGAPRLGKYEMWPVALFLLAALFSIL